MSESCDEFLPAHMKGGREAGRERSVWVPVRAQEKLCLCACVRAFVGGATAITSRALSQRPRFKRTAFHCCALPGVAQAGDNPLLLNDGGDSLDVDVGADDVLDLLRVGILECEGVGSHPDPLSRFGAKPKHDRQDLAFHFHNLWTGAATVQTVTEATAQGMRLKRHKGTKPTTARTILVTVATYHFKYY